MAEKKTPETEAELTEVLRVRREKLAQLVEDGKDPFQITKFDVTHHSAEIKDDFDALEGKEVVVAGRMMSKRVMGKASFCNVQDLKGGIQCYVARDAVGEDSYKDFKKFDIGDIIGVRGEAIFFGSFSVMFVPLFVQRSSQSVFLNFIYSAVPPFATYSASVRFSALIRARIFA